jgi:hypothetical protein
MAVLGALGLMTAVGGATLAIDMARVQLMQNRLQTAIDAATLAGARAIDRGDNAARAAARATFDANMAGLMGTAELTAFEATPTLDAFGNRSLHIRAAARAPLTLAGLTGMFGESAMTAASFDLQSTAAQRMRGAEIALVLDNTGSMFDEDRIGGLRGAMTSMLQVFFGDADSAPGLRIAVVPYTATVNIGTQNDHMLNVSNIGQLNSQYAPARWKGCVMARSVEQARTDNNPDQGGYFTPFLWAPTNCTNIAGLRLCTGNVGALLGIVGQFVPNPRILEPLNRWTRGAAGRVVERPRQRSGSSDYYDAVGPNLNCPAPILPLTASRAEIAATIPQMQPWWRGGTLTNWGLVWGWRAISPDWRGWWRRPDGTTITDLPRTHAEAGLKMIVLMTDGDNMISHDWSSFQRDGDMIAANNLNAEMQRICTAVKNDGIVLFVISFGTVSSATRDALQTCASDPDATTSVPGQKYFHAPNNAQLDAAFRDIAGQLMDLRIVQ